jgi:hypothetical protein
VEIAVSGLLSALFGRMMLIIFLRYSEEEDPDEYPFPLTLRTKRSTGPTSPTIPATDMITNGNGS